MDVSARQLHALSILNPKKAPTMPIDQEAVWAPERFWMLYRREKFVDIFYFATHSLTHSMQHSPS
jgi:hypothetical protein